MPSPNFLIILQSIATFLQGLNAVMGTLTQNTQIALVAGLAIGAFQLGVQKYGNALVPPPKPQDPPKDRP